MIHASITDEKNTINYLHLNERDAHADKMASTEARKLARKGEHIFLGTIEHGSKCYC